MVRQTQEPAHLLGVIADHADRAATEARGLCRRDEGFERDGRIDRRVEEGVEMVVGEGVAPPRVQLPLAPVVTEKDEKVRATGYPVLILQERIDAGADRGVLDDENVPLLQVALRWG